MSAVAIDNLIPNTTYWVRMFSVTAKKVRSHPSASISFTTPSPINTDSNAPIKSIDDCCSTTSDNCRPLCLNLTAMADVSDITTRCPDDAVAIVRCSILAVKFLGLEMGTSEVPVNQCCLDRGLNSEENCCSVPSTVASLKSPVSSCNGADALKTIRQCVAEQLKALGPSPVVQLTVHNVSATRANLSWISPRYNADAVEQYKVRCNMFIQNQSNPWQYYYSDDIDDAMLVKVGSTLELTTMMKETFISLNNLRPRATVRCSVSSTGNVGIFDPTIEFHTDEENYMIFLTINGEDTLKEGDVADFKCEIDDMVYSSVRWFYQPFGATNESEISHDRIEVNSTNFKIPSVSVSDSGTYSCSVFSIYANQTFKAKGPLFVRTKPEAVEKNQRVTCKPNCRPMNCSFKGFPDSINWRKLEHTPNGTKIGFGFQTPFAREGNLAVAQLPPSFFGKYHSATEETFRATAVNFLGIETCDITVSRVRWMRPGWNYVPSLCDLVDDGSCCSIIHPRCPGLCSYSRRCVNTVPTACVVGFQRCQRDNPTIIPPDTAGTFNLTTSAVTSFVKDSIRTRLSFQWLPGKQPEYPFAIEYKMEIISNMDPFQRNVYSVNYKSIDLHVPNVIYFVTVYGENEIGMRSQQNQTLKIRSKKSDIPLPYVHVAREVPNEERATHLIHVLWYWPYCQSNVTEIKCSKAYIYLRPVKDKVEDGDVVPNGRFQVMRTKEMFTVIDDSRPDSDYIVLVCVGSSSRQCIFSEPVYSFANQTVSRKVEKSTSSHTSIAFGVIFGIVVIASLVLFGYCYGRRLFQALTSRFRTRFVFYQRAARSENDRGGIIFGDNDAVELD